MSQVEAVVSIIYMLVCTVLQCFTKQFASPAYRLSLVQEVTALRLTRPQLFKRWIALSTG